MFLGHFAVGFAAKRAARRASLGALVAGAQLIDLLFPLFTLAGLEWFRVVPGDTPFLTLSLDHYPWSHSLLMTAVWALLAGGGYWVVTRYRAGALAIGAAVLSHWVLDWVSHRPDMPLAPGGGPLLGLGLWNSVAGTVVVEAALFVGGVALYMMATRPRDRIGTAATYTLVMFLALVYTASVLSPFPPPSSAAVATIGLVGWLLPLWAWWADRHREVVGGGPGTA